MTRMFGYYDNWRDEKLTCPQCGWEGSIDLDQIGIFKELLDFSCPRCGRMVAIVSYPTMEEAEQNLHRLSDEERAEYYRSRERYDDFQRRALRSPEQLPDLDGSELRLTWAFEETGEERVAVIRWGEQVVWREPAVWEGVGRFEEVVGILKQRYGSRLRDVVPTHGSLLYLLGDDLLAPDRVDAIREKLGG